MSKLRCCCLGLLVVAFLAVAVSASAVILSANPEYLIQDGVVRPTTCVVKTLAGAIVGWGDDPSDTIYLQANINYNFQIYYADTSGVPTSVVTDDDEWEDPMATPDTIGSRWIYTKDASVKDRYGEGRVPGLYQGFSLSEEGLWTLQWGFSDKADHDGVLANDLPLNVLPSATANEWDRSGSVKVLVDGRAPTNLLIDDGDYVGNTTPVSATWDAQDDGSGLSSYSFSVYTNNTPYYSSGWLSYTGDGCKTITAPGSFVPGTVVTFSLVVGDRAGNTSHIQSDGVTVVGPMQLDRGLPTTNLNNASGPNRCNVRWADPNPNLAYGDDFVLPAGNQWAVDLVRVWVVPEVPITPEYPLSSLYQSFTLYGGPNNGPFTAVSSSSATTRVHYQGSQDYQTADGRYNPIWQVDFYNLNWTVDGGVSNVFAVHAAPSVDRLLFLHATDGTGCNWTSVGDGQMRRIDTTSLTTGSALVSGAGWFGGKGSDINVQIFAHAR